MLVKFSGCISKNKLEFVLSNAKYVFVKLAFRVQSDSGITGGVAVVESLVISVVKITGRLVFSSNPKVLAWSLDIKILLLSLKSEGKSICS